MGSLEFFVISLCIGQFECSKASQAYYMQNQELQTIARNTEKESRKEAGPFVSNYVIPVLIPAAFLATNQTGQIKVSEHWGIEGNRDRELVIFQLTY